MLFKFSTICRILYVELIKTPTKKKIDIMNYINAYRTGSNNVRVDYEIENKIVKVNWCNIDAGTGEELSSYYLENIVECDDRELEIIIKDAIDAGEDDSNEYLELYLFIRDTFDSSHASDI